MRPSGLTGEMNIRSKTMWKISRSVIVLYHVTRAENVPSILRDGLKVKYFKERPENSLLGLPKQEAIYLVKDPQKLVKPMRPERDVILKITLPVSVYNKMEKHEGDLEWGIMRNRGDYGRFRAKTMKRAYPESFNGESVGEIMAKSTPLEWMDSSNTVCILEDIPAKYIKQYKS